MTDKQNDTTKKRGGGPKTPEGKVRSSRNSTKHGLTASLILMPHEDPDAFQELLDSYLQDFRPSSNVAADLVHELAACRWRLQRIWDMEAWNLATAQEDRKRSNSGYANTDALMAALGFRDLANRSSVLHLLNRYEARFTHRMHQILAELKALGCVPPVANNSASPQPRTGGKSSPPRAPQAPVQVPVAMIPSARSFAIAHAIPPEVVAA